MNDREWHLNGCKREIGPRGGRTVTVKAVRRNGQTKRWKREPERFSLPVKYGLYEAFRITNTYEGESAERFHSVADCPLNAEEVQA